MQKEVEKFLDSDEFTKPTEKIISMAKGLTIKSILNYLKNNLRYINLEQENPEEWQRVFKKRTAEEVLRTKVLYGCSDSVVLFAALTRASGIPTQFIEGKRVGKSGGHCWARVFIDNNWIDVDPARGSIGISPENADHGPCIVLSRSLGPSDGAIPSYEAWRKIEEQSKKD